MIGSLLEAKLGTPVPVENRTGGSGVIGHTAIADAAPDGQTIGVATLEIGTMHNLGLTDLDYTAYTPWASTTLIRRRSSSTPRAIMPISVHC